MLWIYKLIESNSKLRKDVAGTHWFSSRSSGFRLHCVCLSNNFFRQKVTKGCFWGDSGGLCLLRLTGVQEAFWITCWCIQCSRALKQWSDPWDQLFWCLAMLDTMKDNDSIKEQERDKIRGLQKQALKGRTFFGLLCCEVLSGFRTQWQGIYKAQQQVHFVSLNAKMCQKDKNINKYKNCVVEEIRFKVMTWCYNQTVDFLCEEDHSQYQNRIVMLQM